MMLRRLLRKPSPSMVVALLALFVSMGGVGYAAATIGSSQIRDNSVRSRDLRNNDVQSVDIRDGTLSGKDVRRDALTGANIRESTLGQVPSATNAAHAARAGDAGTVGGRTAASLRLQCPGGTTLAVGLCFEATLRPSANWFAAQADCTGAGRRVPTVAELFSYSNARGPTFRSVELSASVGDNGTAGYYLQFKQDAATNGQPAFVVRAPIGGNTPATDQFRCVVNPTN